jgi:hypothetical protein
MINLMMLRPKQPMAKASFFKVAYLAVGREAVRQLHASLCLVGVAELSVHGGEPDQEVANALREVEHVVVALAGANGAET